MYLGYLNLFMGEMYLECFNLSIWGEFTSLYGAMDVFFFMCLYSWYLFKNIKDNVTYNFYKYCRDS